MVKALYIVNNPGSRAARILRATSHLVEWTLVSRAPLRMVVPGLKACHRWSTAEELKHLLEQPWARESHLWLAAQQLDCEWLPPFVSLCRGQQKNIRIVVDIRDLASLIPKPVPSPTGGQHLMSAISLDELSTFRVADGLIQISGQIAEASCMLHRQAASTPTYVLPCFTGQGEFVHQVDQPEEREGVVYAGGLGPAGPTFRAYTQLFEGLVELGVPPHIYASPTGANGQEIMDQYTVRGCRVHPRVPDEELISTLTRHRWGIVGFPSSFPLGNGALPNKMFEYFAAGLPVIVMFADAAGQMVHNRGLGIWVRNREQFEMLPEMVAKPDLWEIFHKHVINQRAELNMDARAADLVDFFKRVLKKKAVRPGGMRLALESTTVVDPYGQDVDLEELFGKAS